MAVQSTAVTVGTVATELTAYSGYNNGGGNGSSIAVHPASAIFIGGADVTTANGYPVAAGADMTLDLDMGERLYAVAASGTVAVNVLRTGI